MKKEIIICGSNYTVDLPKGAKITHAELWQGDKKIDVTNEVKNPWEEAGRAIKQFNEIMLKTYNESRLFRWLIRWDNFKFDIKHFFKDIIPLWIKYSIYKIKNPRSPWTMR